jgi:hypothetical protein
VLIFRRQEQLAIQLIKPNSSTEAQRLLCLKNRESQIRKVLLFVERVVDSVASPTVWGRKAGER